MIVFLHIHKTAGSTFQFILENTFGISACHTNHTKKKRFTQADLAFALKFFPRLRSIAGHNLIDPLALAVPGAFYMTFVRDPVARAISQYQDSVIKGGNRMSFEDHLRVDDFLENLQVKLMAGERNLDKAKFFLEKCSFVGLTEKFDLSLHVLDKLCPFRLNLNYKRKRTHANNTIRDALMKDERLKAMAADYNKLDAELYSFAVTEIFPRLCAKAGLNPADKVASHDRYNSELKWKCLLNHFYNMCFYRQIYKGMRRFAPEKSA